MKTNVNIDINVNNSNTVGTLNWTAAQLNETKFRLEVMKNGRLAIIDSDDIVIVREAWTGDYSARFHSAMHFSESGKAFNYMSTDNASIFKCYPTEPTADDIEQMKLAGEYPRDEKIYALFGRVLTPAAKRLVESFIEKCAEVLNRAIIAREEAENVALDNASVVVEIKPCDE
jgi:hypothetical protein